MSQNTIVVIEDDNDIMDYVVNILRDRQYVVHTAKSGIQGLELVRQVVPDVVILDLRLPDITGESVCQDIKAEFADTKVIMLTAKDSPEEVAKGLNLGADDYIAKPFSPEVLLARLRARLREEKPENGEIRIGSVSMDQKTHEVEFEGKKINLSPQEFRLLEYMMQNPNQVLSREMILSRLWGTATEVETRVVDVYVGYLRKKLEPSMFRSVRGFGYMLKIEEEPKPTE